MTHVLAEAERNINSVTEDHEKTAETIGLPDCFGCTCEW